MPVRWPTFRLADVCDQVTDGTHHSPKVQYDQPGSRRYKYITSKNVRNTGLDLNDLSYVDEGVHREIFARCAPSIGDILLTKDGANTGNVCINTLDEEFSLLSSVALIKPDRTRLDARFLRHFITSPLGVRNLLGEMTGTAIRRIVLRSIKDLRVPLPPLETQGSIAEQLEVQTSRLHAGTALLEGAQAKLSGYRASMLKSACEGRLVPTEAELARQAGRPGDFEGGEALLARILEERRQSWKGRGGYVEPKAPNAAELPRLPEGWTWTTIECLLREQLRNGHSAKATTAPNGMRVFTLTALTTGDFSEANTKLSSASPDKVAGLWAEPGDMYVTRSNTPQLVGTTRLYNGPARYAFIPDLFIRVRLAPLVMARFVEVYLQSSRGHGFFRRRAQGIAGSMPKIDQEAVLMAPIPLPPSPEQARIVAELDRRLSVVSELESTVRASLLRGASLRQSILQRAFSSPLESSTAHV